MATATTIDDRLVLPTPLEGTWQTGKKASETLTIGDYTATLTPDGKGAKRTYTLTRRGKQVDTGTFVRTPRKAMNKLLHQRHFAALPTGLLSDWLTALKNVLREREEARWTDSHGEIWRRWQAVLTSLENRSPAGKILEDFQVTEIDGQRMLTIIIRSGGQAPNLSQRKWTVTGWAPLHKDAQYPEQLAPLAVTRVSIRTTSSDGTGDHHYTLTADTDWGHKFAHAVTRTAAELALYLQAVDTDCLSN
ncbi:MULTISPECIES: hypothetical protein [unclassified Nocardia]|uniref:hypothetical protein n=1 Tax=unclassified Nocardia TaxID=2637762 RepID=UPI001CE3E9A7|nr:MULTISPECIES: hypothetical protein [unclassified Nocardia]